MVTRKTAQIKQLLNLDRYNMHDFWSVCPYTPAELRNKNRKAEIRAWRQLGMVWMVLSDESLTDAARHFNRDHATVIHAQGIVIDTLDGYGDYLVRKDIELMKDHILSSSEIHGDMCINEAVCMVVLDGFVGRRVVEAEKAQRDYEQFINKSNQ